MMKRLQAKCRKASGPNELFKVESDQFIIRFCFWRSPVKKKKKKHCGVLQIETPSTQLCEKHHVHARVSPLLLEVSSPHSWSWRLPRSQRGVSICTRRLISFSSWFFPTRFDWAGFSLVHVPVETSGEPHLISASARFPFHSWRWETMGQNAIFTPRLITQHLVHSRACSLA